MATTLTSLSEYLATGYRPDCDYVGGEIEERNVGKRLHSATQNFFSEFLGAHKKEWNLTAAPEQRVQVSADRVRVADVVILRRDTPYEEVLTRAPLAVIEVLSPEDRMYRYDDRLADYRRMGIPAVWIVDPERRGAFDCTAGPWNPVREFRVPGTMALIDLNELWTELDAICRAGL
jgi:Uma2 family endonuclease